MFSIKNDGPEISHTDYWTSEPASKGYAYLTWNSGAARLLLPATLVGAISDMLMAKVVIISRGPWQTPAGLQTGIEILFEDYSDEPYCITLLELQTDRCMPGDNQGEEFPFAIWTVEGKVMTLPAKFRIVKELPCMDAWTDH